METQAVPARLTPPDGWVIVPGKKPAQTCGAHGRRGFCTRPKGHSRRHAYIWWQLGRAFGGGVLREVWE